MLVNIKSDYDIEKIFFASKIVSEVLRYIYNYIKIGTSTGYLNDICHDRIVNYHKAIPASLGYGGFPKSVCISVNEEVCHGIPSYNKILKEGDLVNIDVSVIKNKYYSDSSRMYFVGNRSFISNKLCSVTENSIFESLRYVKPGNKFSVIGYTIQRYVSLFGFTVVKDYCGHGVGFRLHEPPNVLHCDNNVNILFKPGMVFTIEPMVNVGSEHVVLMNDGWTVKTRDNSLSAQYEHTVLVTNKGYKILTVI